MTAQDEADIIAFLQTLNDGYSRSVEVEADNPTPGGRAQVRRAAGDVARTLDRAVRLRRHQGSDG